jgi:hypothetical protein
MPWCNMLTWTLLLGLLAVGGMLLFGAVIVMLVFSQANKGRGSSSRQDEFARLREDYERACSRIERLEEENRRLRQLPPVPDESRITPSE